MVAVGVSSPSPSIVVGLRGISTGFHIIAPDAEAVEVSGGREEEGGRGRGRGRVEGVRRRESGGNEARVAWERGYSHQYLPREDPTERVLARSLCLLGMGLSRCF